MQTHFIEAKRLNPNDFCLNQPLLSAEIDFLALIGECLMG